MSANNERPYAVVAPCHPFNPTRLQEGLDIAEQRGWKLQPLPDLLRPHLHLAADDTHRRAQLIEALTSPQYGGVWLARGGSGLTRLLASLPWSDLPKRPVVGFSDGTALLCALNANRGGLLIHGPVINSLPDTSEDALDHLDHLLDGQTVKPLCGETWVQGTATGPIVGGNLSVLASMCGTPWQTDAQGKLLLLEDIGEPAYRIDRLLQQLADAGVFRGVSGIALGGFTSCPPPKGSSWTLRDLLLEQLGSLNVPVVGELPFGHISNNYAIPIGALGTLRDGQLSWSLSPQA